MNMISVTSRRRRWARRATTLLACAVGTALVASPLGAAGSGAPTAPAAAGDQAGCESATTWQDVALDGAEVTGVRSAWNETGQTLLTPQVGSPAGGAPFCEVEVTLTHGVEGGSGPDEAHVWVWLPQEWNGRMQAVGGGGTQATNGPRAMRPALAAGYAVVASDSGVRPSRQPNIFLREEGGFDWQLFENWSHRGVRDSALVGEQVIAAHYGEAAAYTYWNGCSNGGRQGLAMAQRDPDLFDGVLAGAPALYGADRLNMTMSWPAMVQQDAYGGFLPTCKLQAMTEAVREWCDGDDGVRDGLVGVPSTCDYERALSTVVGEQTPCGEITARDVEVVGKIFEGPRTPDGRFVWYGLTPGIDLTGGVVRVGPSFAFQNFAFADTTVDWTDYTADDLVTTVRPRLQGRLELLATANPSLDRFRRAGGKLLVWHGEADGLFPSAQSVHYYEEVARLTGAQTDDYFRLFLAPGVDHCSGGTGPAPVDPLAALVAWVERGEAPETLPARKVDATTGAVVAERDLCRYPLQPRYLGGPADRATSFDCAASADALRKVGTTVQAGPFVGTPGQAPRGTVRVRAAEGTPRGMVDVVHAGRVVASGRLEDGTSTLTLPADVPNGTVTLRYRGYGQFAGADSVAQVRRAPRAGALVVSGPDRWRHGARVSLDVQLPGVAGRVTVGGPGFTAQADLVDGRGTVTLPRRIPAGRHDLTFTWAGDEAVEPTSLVRPVRVLRSRTTSTLSRSGPPRSGRRTVEVRVRAVDGGRPTGTVRFRLSRGGRTVLARTVRLGPDRVASLRLPGRGTGLVTARYRGSDDHRPSSTRMRVGPR